MALVKKSVEEWVNSVNYKELNDGSSYIPSEFALKYINFIKLVNGEDGESNKSPVVHMKMLDELAGDKVRLANLCSRGFGKTVLFGEYLVLYIAVFGGIEGFGDIEGMIYVSDSMENGAKSLRKNIEHRYNNSEFLQKYIAEAKFTDPFIEFKNVEGKRVGIRLFGAKTGLRGTKIYGKRPTLAVLDDLVSDADANSPTVMRAIKDTVYKGVDYALDPTKRKIVFCGTPFNKADILYEAVESGAWHVNVYPICEKFPCSEEDFVGAWEDRFSYKFVKDMYDAAMATGEIASFNQELMLRIMSEEDRLIRDSDIMWYNRNDLMNQRHRYNFYITTDFATSAKESADFSVISVWAYNNNGDWFWVDGECARMDMSDNLDHLFRLAQMYKPQSVGVEVSGQQGGFVSWIRAEMLKRNVFFSLASENNNGAEGIRPVTNKLVRFNTVVPLFKQKKIFFPTEMQQEATMVEAMDELRLVCNAGFKSKHDDFCSSGDTLIEVLLPDGSTIMQRFDRLVDGNVVRTFNEDTKTYEWQLVKGFMQTGICTTYTVTDDVDNLIHLTHNHTILTQRGWVAVCDLQEGDFIKCKSKNTVIRGLKNLLGITSLQLISLMEKGIGYIKRFIKER